MAEAEIGEPLGGRLVLRHTSNRSSGTWGPDDYDVMSGGRDIGRIHKCGAAWERRQNWISLTFNVIPFTLGHTAMW